MSQSKSSLRRKRKGIKYDQHVRLHHWLLNSEAYLHLPPTARALLVEVMRIYNGSNNGRLALSVRDAGARLRVSKNTASRAFTELVEKGFLVLCKPSGFNVKTRLATEWRLTEFRDNVTHEIPTKAFMRWRPEIQNTVPRQ